MSIIGGGWGWMVVEVKAGIDEIFEIHLEMQGLL